MDSKRPDATIFAVARRIHVSTPAQPAIEAAFGEHPRVMHLKIEDGPGRRLGRSFRIKLWPTLVFLRDGQEIARTVRPLDSHEVTAGLQGIDPDGAAP